MDETPRARGRFTSSVHYYGVVVRTLFFAAAILIFIAGFTAGKLPFDSLVSTLSIITLVLVSGLTNPLQPGIRWLNIFVSATGVLVFGGYALNRFHGFGDLLSNGFFIALLTIIFIVCLYFATGVVRASRAPIHP